MNVVKYLFNKTSNGRYQCQNCKQFATVHEVKEEEDDKKPTLSSLRWGREVLEEVFIIWVKMDKDRSNICQSHSEY
ncbi:MAG: hypothetical protein ACOC5T_00330 [Elusimicrobiota bacterium]